ncbi:site-2 protease family protein [Ohtaekwangia koreensis]|uniref:Peptidase family M50 n=1 Tax=Ohtaekwangia koreensis TaxID=688867 RepID=A0A1T5MFA7_9BACT|nr:site-2 protease family protein [Ohtaekwangia koreensis]SKC86654.1 Peptidase family M50 [Ohtaekwangia koreensis]
MPSKTRTVLIQVGLFIASFITTTFAGAEWCFGKSIFYGEYTWNDFLSGMQFSIPFLLILTVHEFGHYFTAMYHKIRASLPYYIPFPPNPIIPSIGTLGAVIRIEEKVRSNRQHFDIGLAGPLAGFILALAIIVYGFATLPPAEYVFNFHPEYKQFGLDYAKHVYSPEYMKDHSALDLQIGDNLLYMFCEKFVADPSRIPNPHELMHYPFLLAGFIALFFTSMNLLPIGQLDGGHVTYGLFGSRGHKLIATIFFLLLTFYSGLGLVTPTLPQTTLLWAVPALVLFYYSCFAALKISKRDRIMYALILFAAQFVISWGFPQINGYSGWLLFGFIVSRFVGIEHPPSEIEMPLDPKRVILGWVTLLIFILCFSPTPLVIEVVGGNG